ncbi:peptidoglycan-binding domain-containing protein [Roseivivax sp. CAU 1753]
MIRIAAPVACLALAVACTPLGDAPEKDVRPGFNTMGLGDDDSRPDPAGGCYATERTPAAYVEVPSQVLVVPAEVDADGTVTRAPIYRNTTVSELVRPGAELRFPAPCPPVFTPEFIGTLQRALLARNFYGGAVTERMDPPTRAAIRAYQTARGLDSDKLALETAKSLGLIAIDLPELEAL